MDFRNGAYNIPDEFKNKVNFSFFQYDHFLALIPKNSFFNFEGCDSLEPIEKVNKKGYKKGKKFYKKGKKV
jgi:hypothetical protein